MRDELIFNVVYHPVTVPGEDRNCSAIASTIGYQAKNTPGTIATGVH
jgi:hypothetical protein